MYIFLMLKPRSSLKSHLNAKERNLYKELDFNDKVVFSK